MGIITLKCYHIYTYIIAIKINSWVTLVCSLKQLALTRDRLIEEGGEELS
jgi:hypothetical protein